MDKRGWKEGNKIILKVRISQGRAKPEATMSNAII
jgi:hypothetical protein